MDSPVLVDVGNSLLTNLTGRLHSLVHPLMVSPQIGKLGELVSTKVANRPWIHFHRWPAIGESRLRVGDEGRERTEGSTDALLPPYLPNRRRSPFAFRYQNQCSILAIT